MRLNTRKKKGILIGTIEGFVNVNAKYYILLSLLFLIGIVLGILIVNNASEESKNQSSYCINNYIESVKSNGQISKIELLKGSLKNNIAITLLFWFLGCTIIGMPLIYIATVYKGYSIGYTVASVLYSIGTGKGILFIISTIILQYIIYIPCILTLGVSGIELYKSIIGDRHKENIKAQILKHTIMCILIFLLLIIGSLIETYISGNLTYIALKCC